jgi:hypothetical protein
MGSKRSRTYRMRLSRDGTRLFLSCHCRLAHLVGAFIPYGTTLYVAVILADAGDPSDLLAELDAQSIGRLLGSFEHFVGASASLSDLVSVICDRLARSDILARRPPVSHVHLASLALMASSEDDALTRAYIRMASMLA